MRKYINLIESVTDDFGVNNEIEEKLSNHSKEDRPIIRDGIESFMDAEQITVASWAGRMRTLWPDMTTENLKRIFKIILSDFPKNAVRLGDSVYKWQRTLNLRMSNMDPRDLAGRPYKVEDEDDGLDHSDPTLELAKQQIAVTSLIQKLMKKTGTFASSTISAMLTQSYGIPTEMADTLVQHVIDQTGATIKSIGDGRYRWEEMVSKKPAEYISMWKDMAKRAGDIPPEN